LGVEVSLCCSAASGGFLSPQSLYEVMIIRGVLKENPYLQFFIGLEAFQYSAPFDASMMVNLRKRLPVSDVNDCNERIVRHGLEAIKQQQDDDEPSDSGSADGSGDATAGHSQSTEKSMNQGILLIGATCAPADIRYPTDLSLLNEAREATEKLIYAMHGQVRDRFGHKPRTYRRKARKQFLAVAKQKLPRLEKIRKAIVQQLRRLQPVTIQGSVRAAARKHA
jgi:transposase, IS5 family